MNQDKIFRAVAGAVRNTANAHPDWNIKPEYAPSIAKRATGTLMAQLPDVLAVTPSDRDAVISNNSTAVHSPGGIGLNCASRIRWFIDRGYSSRRIAELTGAPIAEIAAQKLGLTYQPGERTNFPSLACSQPKEDASHGNP